MMNIQAEKLELIKLLMDTESPQIINSIKQIFTNNNDADFWSELTPSQKKEIQQGLNEVKDGKVIDYDLYMSNHR